MSTTSGAQRRRAATASAPSRGLADDLDAAELEDHPQPLAHQVLVVDDQHPGHRRPPVGIRTRRRSRRRATLGGERPAEQLGAVAHAGEPAARDGLPSARDVGLVA